jgi:uracil-DNA glycosylase
MITTKDENGNHRRKTKEEPIYRSVENKRMTDSITKLQSIREEITACRRCARLVQWREEVARTKRRAYQDWDYWGKPVPGYGDPMARILIVGLAPAAHGANRTGRVFTGDGSGDFLFPALYRAGFANQPESKHRDDGLHVKDIYFLSVCRCAPPANKPLPGEIENCRPFMLAEMRQLSHMQGIVALGKIAFDNVLTAYRQLGRDMPRLAFGHDVLHALGEGLPWLLASYHPSRQNTQTGKLTVEMFDHIWQRATGLLTD